MLGQKGLSLSVIKGRRGGGSGGPWRQRWMACQSGALFREVLEPCQSARVKSGFASRGATCPGSLIQTGASGPPAADPNTNTHSLSFFLLLSHAAATTATAIQLCLPYAPTQTGQQKWVSQSSQNIFTLSLSKAAYSLPQQEVPDFCGQEISSPSTAFVSVFAFVQWAVKSCLCKSMCGYLFL